MKPNSAIGFSAILNATEVTRVTIRESISRVLRHFDDINQLDLNIGNTAISIWGRGELEKCYTFLPDGSLLILIGSPIGSTHLSDLTDQILTQKSTQEFRLPWEGRVILLRIDPQDDSWTLWNDWIGSIPVFHAKTPNGRIASTLEPLVVDTCNFASSEINPLGLLSLLIWGHYFSDWTLYKSMKVVPPDCVAIWNHSSFTYNQLFSVNPSEDNWFSGWDDLIDEMYQLSYSAIQVALEEQDTWILPLSSGLDSRLIAGVAAEIGKNVRAFTWGLPKSSDVIHAKKIAKKLGIPWKHIPSGDTYLTEYRTKWSDMFGSAMHFHGMYQMPFMDALKDEKGLFVSGFIGECLTGYDTKFLLEVNATDSGYQIAPDGYLHWQLDELRELINDPIEGYLREIEVAVKELIEKIPGATFQKLKFLILWGRQRHFTYFQSMMCDYWKGVVTPYMDRNYARFSLSLPRAVTDDRLLQQAMLTRYFAKLAAIPGTYAREPALLTGSYLLKKRVSNFLPNNIAWTLFPDLYRTKPNSEIDCVIRDQQKAFFPLFEKLVVLDKWMSREVIGKTFDQIIEQQDSRAVRKLQSIQTLAYRLES